MLFSKGKITEYLARMLMSRHHSGFNVFFGPRIYPREEQAMENLARYIIRASFSQERMTYLEEVSRVCKNQKVFAALGRLAAICSYMRNEGEQMVRYFGHYSNLSRGTRKRKTGML